MYAHHNMHLKVTASSPWVPW